MLSRNVVECCSEQHVSPILSEQRVSPIRLNSVCHPRLTAALVRATQGSTRESTEISDDNGTSDQMIRRKVREQWKSLGLACKWADQQVPPKHPLLAPPTAPCRPLRLASGL